MIARMGGIVIAIQIVVLLVTFFAIYSNYTQPQILLAPQSVKAAELSDTTSLTAASSSVTSRGPRVTNPSTPSEIVTDQSSTTRKVRLHTFLLIMIPNIAESFSNRELIRSTWYKGYNDSEDAILRFAIGTAGISENVSAHLAVENNTYGDLIFFKHFKESRLALTNKTMLILKWANENVDFSYYLKCDDDTFVFVKNTITILRSRPTTKRLYYGKIQKGRPKKKGDLWLDMSWNLGDTYLPYALGGAYIISSDLVALITNDIDLLEWHPNEDTAVGSWLAPYKYERRDNDLICMFLETEKKSKKCPEYHIINLFYGITRIELEKHFKELCKKL